jgi:hypothetical protein
MSASRRRGVPLPVNADGQARGCAGLENPCGLARDDGKSVKTVPGDGDRYGRCGAIAGIALPARWMTAQSMQYSPAAGAAASLGRRIGRSISDGPDGRLGAGQRPSARNARD